MAIYDGQAISDNQSRLPGSTVEVDQALAVLTAHADFTPLADPFLANLTNSYLYYRQDTRYQFNPSVGNLLNLIWRAITIKKAIIPFKEN